MASTEGDDRAEVVSGGSEGVVGEIGMRSPAHMGPIIVVAFVAMVVIQ